jgi:putative transposase
MTNPELGWEVAMPLLAADPVNVLREQREVLEQLVRSHSTPQQLAMRARMILHAADGTRVRASARELGVWPKTVRYWRKRGSPCSSGWPMRHGREPVCTENLIRYAKGQSR